MKNVLCKTVICLALLVVVLASISLAQANEVLIEWGTASKQLVTYPQSIDYVTRVTVRVNECE